MPAFDLIAFDADDTLWHSETLYAAAQDRFGQILAPYCSDPAQVQAKLDQTEAGNIPYYGYGIKSFALSMIQAAIELSEKRISGAEIYQLIEVAQEMVTAEVRLLEHTEDALSKLVSSHSLMLITKGDLLDQEAKITRSGLRQFFQYIEIVSDKTRNSYAALLDKHHLNPERFLMIGNSLRSDILPVVELGGWAVYIPYHITWEHEHAHLPDEYQARYFSVEHIGLLPDLIAKISSAS